MPDADRQRQLLALAEQEVAASRRPAREGFAELWERVEGMLTSYSDETVRVGAVRPRAVGGADPRGGRRAHQRRPARADRHLARHGRRCVAAHASTISCCSICWTSRPSRRAGATSPKPRRRTPRIWSASATSIRPGSSPTRWCARASGNPARAAARTAALERFGRGTMMRHVSSHLRGSDDDVVRAVQGAVPRDRSAGDSRARRSCCRRRRTPARGAGCATSWSASARKGRESVQQLMSAPNWEVRRTAAFLLREFGGAEGLKELIPLLTDSEPLVQREAVQGLVLNGSDEASRMLMQAITSATGRSRETLLKELTSIRDERAAPVFSYLVRHMDRRKEQPAVHVGDRRARHLRRPRRRGGAEGRAASGRFLVAAGDASASGGGRAGAAPARHAGGARRASRSLVHAGRAACALPRDQS